MVWYTSDSDVARMLKKLCTSKGDYWIKQRFSSIASLFKWELLLKARICSHFGANSFLSEQLIIVWKITFITLSDLPWMLLFLIRTCVTRVMGSTPMLLKTSSWLVLKPHKAQVQNHSIREILLDSSQLLLKGNSVKHVFLCINICWNPRVVLKPQSEKEGFNDPRGV